MLVELGMITAFSFYKSNGAEFVPILLIIVQWGFCHRDEEGQRMQIKTCIIIKLLKYTLCCGLNPTSNQTPQSNSLVGLD